MKKQDEYKMQAAFVYAVQMKYKGSVIVFSDTAAHIGKTMQQQLRANKLSSNFKQPDMTIFAMSEIYGALLIEWKAKSPYKKNSTELLKNEHIEAQNDCLNELKARGYAAVFCWDVHTGLQYLEGYLNNKIITQKYE